VFFLHGMKRFLLLPAPEGGILRRRGTRRVGVCLWLGGDGTGLVGVGLDCMVGKALAVSTVLRLWG
jgi:hypothetical protein